MRIGFLVHPDFMTRPRTTGPAAALSRAGHDVVIERMRGADCLVDQARLRTCDVVLVYQIVNRQALACADDLREHGTAVVWDTDADFRLLPEEVRRHMRHRALAEPREVRNQRRMVRRADVVTTTTAGLAERLADLDAVDVVQVANRPEPEQYAGPRRLFAGFALGWFARPEHLADANALSLSAVLGRILDRHPVVRVVTIGVRLDLESDRYEHLPLMSAPELHEAIRGFDLGLAPIADIPISYIRSDIKVKEYAAAGVPWLASDRGAYAGLGAREGGVLVQDDGWEHAINQLLGSRLRRYRLRRRAIAWGESECIDEHVGDWVAVFERAITIAQERRASTRASA